MKYDDLNLKRIREVPIFDVCSKLGISLYGMGKLTKRTKCWYHDDKHPSMHVNKKKNIYKCFVCGKGGDVIKLVQDYDNKTFIEACNWLVSEFHVVLIEDKPLSAGNYSKSNSKLNNSETNSDQFDFPLRAVELNLPSEAGPKSVPSVQSVVPLSPDLVSRSLSLDSQFCKSVVSAGYLTDAQLSSAVSRYRLGATKDGGVIFWQIDDQQRIRTGKIMYYQPDCHRSKDHHPTWVHCLMKDDLPQDYTLHRCLFGQHLLSGKAPGATVCVVESEKTAVICSERLPDSLWLACGGLQMFSPEMLAPLVDHKVILFPDTDLTGDTYRRWADIALQASKLYQFRYPLRVSRLLESHATPDQKQRKIDLVDFLYSA